jgi:hypothetical protein
MQPFDDLRFFFFILFNEDFPAINRVADGKPKKAFSAGKALFFGHFKNLFGIVNSFCNLLKSPSYDTGLRFLWGDKFPTCLNLFILDKYR